MTIDWALLSIVAPALAVSLLVAAIHVPLGLEVIKRGIIFIDLATAQIAGLGAIAATLYFGEPHGLQDIAVINVFAVAAALISAIFFAWVERYFPRFQEALIGCTFVLAASMALLILANQPLGSEAVEGLLAGQILFTSWPQAALIAVIYLPLLVVWFGFRQVRRGIGFYIVFAIAVTASVQVVGVYLVFASLIFPALAVQKLSPRLHLLMGYGVAIIGTLVGLIGTVVTDYPTGPMLVWSLAAIALLGSALTPRANQA